MYCESKGNRHFDIYRKLLYFLFGCQYFRWDVLGNPAFKRRTEFNTKYQCIFKEIRNFNVLLVWLAINSLLTSSIEEFSSIELQSWECEKRHRNVLQQSKIIENKENEKNVGK